jgi:hypothetical protein
MDFEAKTDGRATRSVSASIVLAICVLGACSCGSGTTRLDKREYIREMRAIEDSSAGRRAWRLYDNVVLTQPEGRHYSRHTSGGGSVVLVDEAAEPVAAADLAYRRSFSSLVVFGRRSSRARCGLSRL